MEMIEQERCSGLVVAADPLAVNIRRVKLTNCIIKWWYCSWPIAPAQCCCFLFVQLFVDNLFFYLGGHRPVSEL